MSGTDKHIKRLFFQLLTGIVLFLLCVGIFVIAVDPYQQYRNNDNYIANQRLSIAGIAKHHDYDAFFTGSSMSMNHYPEQVDSLWGWKTRNFSIMGATYADYEIILPYILKQGKARNIIVNLDFFSFARDRSVVNEYLYDDNVWNDYEYLYNYTTLSNCIALLRNPLPVENLYHFNSPTGREVLVNSFDKTMSNVRGYEGENFDYEYMKYNFDNSFLSIIKNTPPYLTNINWYIYFPPYSIGEFIVYKNFGNLDNLLRFKQYMIEQLSQIDGVQIFDFQCEPWITNLDEYMDLRHHSHSYNKRIMEAIHDGKYKLDCDSILFNNNRLRELVVQYADSLSR